MEISLRLAATPKDLLSEGAEPFISQILKGVSLSVRLNVWRKLGDVMLRIVEAGEIDSSMLPFFGGMAPAFLLRLNAQLSLTVDDHMQSKLQDNPLIQPLLMDAHTLIGATSSVGSDEELEEHLDNLGAPQAISHLLKVLIEHMGDEIGLSVTHPQLGL